MLFAKFAAAIRCAAVFLTVAAFAPIDSAPQDPTKLPDGLYARLDTTKGVIIARLEMDLTPLAASSFVGLAEGTVANAAFDPGHPYFNGTVWHRVVPGHVIQTGIPQSTRAKGPGYSFTNEVNAKLNHNHAGAMNMANGGPGTNGSQFCFMLGDRSYLNGNYTVFGDVVQGLDVVMSTKQGDVINTVRILRVGAKAQAFHPTTESFKTLLEAAQQRAAEHLEKKKVAEREWIQHNHPKATGADGGALSEVLSKGQAGAASNGNAIRVRYRGTELHYVGDVMDRQGPALDLVSFASDDAGAPVAANAPKVFTYEAGKTKLNRGLEEAIKSMAPGEHRFVIVPVALGYGRSGLYAPEVPGQRRLVISPNSMLVYDVEVLAD